MPFKVLQKYHSAHCCPVVSYEQVTLESGQIIEQEKDLSEETLPDAELFDLDNVLKAGIEPEEVQSTIMKSKTVDADKVIRKYTKKNKNNEGENVNEK